MKKIILPFIVLCVALLPLSSCDDRLDIPQKGSQSTLENYYKTDSDVRSGIALCYWTWTVMYNDLAWMADLLSDDVYAGGGNASDNVNRHQLNNYNIATENSIVEYNYEMLYRLIYYSNLVIEKTSENEVKTNFMNQCIAEAYFFRGFCNYWLAVFWGNPPIVDHLLDPSEYSPANSEEGECMEQAAKDFRAALEMHSLLSKSGPNDKSKMAYVTEEAVKSCLAKVYMYQGNYEEGARLGDEVIDSGKYALWTGPFEDMLKYNGNWNCENMLECQAPEDTNFDVEYSFSNYTFLSAGWRLDAFDWSKLDDQVITTNPDGSQDTTMVCKPEWADMSRAGYGFLNPRKVAYDAFVKSDGKEGYRTVSSIKTTAFVRDTMGLSLLTYLHGHDQYFSWKTRLLNSDALEDNGGWNILNKTTQRWMRYAEVLLNTAECWFQAGNTAKATEYVNMVRARAKAPLYSSVDLDKIKLERQVELYCEHNRWPDLIRWGDAARVLADQGKVTLDLDINWQTYEDESSNPAFGFKAGRNERLPYPSREVLLNPNIKQNPGY